MNLYILRHGLAAELGELGLPKDLKDADRPLTAKGKQKLWRTTEAMQAMEIKLDVVIASPLLRAMQTAQIVTEALGLRRKLILTDELTPGGSPKALLDAINALGPRTRNILLVGHEPYLSKLIALLAAGNTGAAIDLKKGGLAKLELKKLRYTRCATLAWLLTPKQLYLMA
jgi:phosphohistidine phosphatase